MPGVLGSVPLAFRIQMDSQTGIHHGKGHSLLCWEDHAVGISDDNKGVIVISLDQIHTMVVADI